MTITNCTIIGNTAEHGGGIYKGSSDGLIPTVTNCILWGNDPTQIWISPIATDPPLVTYSDVQGGWSGVGNIDDDPLFMDADNNLRLSPGSPCIDAGDDTAVFSLTDLDGNPRIQGTCVDMGAFEAPPAAPETMLAGLALFILDEVDSGNIDPELEGSLLVKIDAALAALDRGNPNDAKVAMNDLKALMNQVEAQTNKKITPEVAAEIIQKANAIIADLSG